MKKIVSLLVAVTLVTSVGTSLASEKDIMLISANPMTFEDVEANHWAKSSIERWKNDGVINGYDDNTYKPSNSITRAEFIAMIERIFVPTAKADLSKYSDVDKNAWYYDSLAKAVKMGIINGRSETELAPTDLITRQEAMTIIYRLLAIKDGRTISLNSYTDANTVADWAKEAAAYMTRMGFVNGYEDGTLNPTGYITRAETAKVLDRTFTKVIREAGTYDLSNVDGNVVIAAEDVVITGNNVAASIYIVPSVDSSKVSTKNADLDKDVIVIEEDGTVATDNKQEEKPSSSGGGSSVRIETHKIAITETNTGKYKFKKSSNTGSISTGDKLTVTLDGKTIFEGYKINDTTLKEKVTAIINELDDEKIMATVSDYKNNSTVQQIGLKVLAAMGRDENEYDDIMDGTKGGSAKEMAVRALQYLSASDLLKLANEVAK